LVHGFRQASVLRVHNGSVGGTVWFANIPRQAVTPAERQSTTPEQWKEWLVCPDAFTGLSAFRRPRVERIVAQGARTSSSKAAGPIGRVVRDLVLPLVFRSVVTEKSLAWIYEHHVEWDNWLEPTSQQIGR
jgi:hypothetical protein